MGLRRLLCRTLGCEERKRTRAPALLEPSPSATTRALQLLIASDHRRALQEGRRRSFQEVGFNVHSQTDEDGILLYLFTALGFENRRAVDIGSGGINQSNVANLIVNHHVEALLIDANEERLGQAIRYYAAHPETRLFPPRAVSTFVTRENVNGILKSAGFDGPLDLLCIDIDGIDYWIWDALEVCDPRVVLVEYHDILGPDRSVTVPYRPDFDASSFEVYRERNDYSGASLRAFTKLADRKGYRLVGASHGGWNAFFVKRQLGEEVVPEVSVTSCFSHPWNEYGMRERWPRVADMPWEEVGTRARTALLRMDWGAIGLGGRRLGPLDDAVTCWWRMRLTPRPLCLRPMLCPTGAIGLEGDGLAGPGPQRERRVGHAFARRFINHTHADPGDINVDAAEVCHLPNNNRSPSLCGDGPAARGRSEPEMKPARMRTGADVLGFFSLEPDLRLDVGHARNPPSAALGRCPPARVAPRGGLARRAVGTATRGPRGSEDERKPVLR